MKTVIQKNTVTEINTSLYKRIPSINIYGTELKSGYNHNYFYNKNTGDLILEETDDDQTCYYYRIEENNTSINNKYLGLTTDQYGFGIFDKDYEGYPTRDEHSLIVLDSNEN